MALSELYHLPDEGILCNCRIKSDLRRLFEIAESALKKENIQPRLANS